MPPFHLAVRGLGLGAKIGDMRTDLWTLSEAPDHEKILRHVVSTHKAKMDPRDSKHDAF